MIFLVKYIIFLIIVSAAAYADYKSRLIPDFLWIICAILETPIFIYEIIQGTVILNTLTLFPLVTIYGLIIILWRYRLMGEADIIYLALLNTYFTFPTIELKTDVFQIPGFLVLSIILFSSVLAVVATMIINIYTNIRIYRAGKLIYPDSYTKFKKFLMFISMHPVEEHKVDNLKYIPGMCLSIDKCPRDINKLKFTVDSSSYVWISYGIPMIIWFTIGMYLHLILFIVS